MPRFPPRAKAPGFSRKLMKLVASIIMLVIYILIATVAFLLCAVFLGATAWAILMGNYEQAFYGVCGGVIAGLVGGVFFINVYNTLTVINSKK